MSSFDGADDPREARLPRWAQEKIRNLRRERNDAVKRADEVRRATDPADSNALLDYYDEIPIGLGNRPVWFRLDGESLVHCRVEHGKLVVHGSQPGHGALNVQPMSSNVVYIVVRD